MPTFADRVDAVTVESLRARRTEKWTVCGPNGFGAGVAEMDFGAAPAVLEALAEVSAKAEFGYPSDRWAAELGAACSAWQRDRYGWEVPPDSIHPLADVLAGLGALVTHLSRPDAPIILPTPAYMPFLLYPGYLGREIIQVPMRDDGSGRYGLDLDGIDAAFRRGGHVVILCNPYNPLGRVFDRDELTALTAVVDRHGGRVFADEIHAPLVYAGSHHVPYASTSDTAAAHAVTATSASKGWNLPGLKCAQLLLSNEADRDAWTRFGHFVSHGASNAGIAANVAAYRDGRDWLDDARRYLDGNRMLLADQLREHLPRVRYRPPDGTYLAWLDFRDVALSDSPGTVITDRSGVVVVDGPHFGIGGAGSVRFNFATSRPLLTEMVQRMARAIGEG